MAEDKLHVVNIELNRLVNRKSSDNPFIRKTRREGEYSVIETRHGEVFSRYSPNGVGAYFSAKTWIPKDLAERRGLTPKRLADEVEAEVSLIEAGDSYLLEARIPVVVKKKSVGKIARDTFPIVWDNILNPLLWYLSDDSNKQ